MTTQSSLLHRDKLYKDDNDGTDQEKGPKYHFIVALLDVIVHIILEM
jgi:hypothetical protein